MTVFRLRIFVLASLDWRRVTVDTSGRPPSPLVHRPRAAEWWLEELQFPGGRERSAIPCRAKPDRGPAYGLRRTWLEDAGRIQDFGPNRHLKGVSGEVGAMRR